MTHVTRTPTTPLFAGSLRVYRYLTAFLCCLKMHQIVTTVVCPTFSSFRGGRPQTHDIMEPTNYNTECQIVQIVQINYECCMQYIALCSCNTQHDLVKGIPGRPPITTTNKTKGKGGIRKFDARIWLSVVLSQVASAFLGGK